eukprot:scaffold126202_cov63-Phaeocystis_antarctica.AAC.2
MRVRHVLGSLHVVQGVRLALSRALACSSEGLLRYHAVSSHASPGSSAVLVALRVGPIEASRARQRPPARSSTCNVNDSLEFVTTVVPRSRRTGGATRIGRGHV